MTPRQRKILEAAIKRPARNVCPTQGVRAGAQAVMLRALRLQGWITDSPVPTVTDEGVRALAAEMVADKLTAHVLAEMAADRENDRA